MRALILLLTLTLAASAQLTWSLAGSNASWPADKRTAIVNAMTEAAALYNANGHFPKSLWINYDPSVPTANGNYNGAINFGGSINTRVALHEISHTLGVGQFSTWNTNRSGNTWTGSFAINRVRLFNGPTATLSADTAHFWPYGLNFDSEDGTTNRVRHIKMVSALRRDMGIVQDSDGDAIPDDWEIFYFGNLSQTATGDSDADGVNNLAEYNADTHPASHTTQWNGTTNSDYTGTLNWAPTPGPSNGTFFTRININNNSNSPLIYDATRGTTTLRPPDRGLVIGSGANNANTSGALTLTGGSLSTLGARSPDIIGNGQGNSGTLTLENGTFSSTELQFGVSGQGTGTLILNGGNANIDVLAFRFGTGGTGNIQLNTATLTTSGISRTGSGTGTLTLNGGTLRASASSPTFFNNLTNTFIRSAGATFDTSTFSISIPQILRNDPSSPNGGITKSGPGTLTLSAPNTFIGPTTISAGILVAENASALSTTASVATDATLALTASLSYQKTLSLTLSGTGQRTTNATTPATQRGALQSISGNNTWAGAITISSPNTRIGVQDGAALTITGTISESTPASSVILRAGLNPGDDITLTAPASWTGDSIAYSSSSTGGALRLGASNVLPTSSALLIAGNSVAGRLDLNGFSQTVAGLSNATGGSSPIGNGIITNNGPSPSTLTLATTTNRTFIGTIQDGSQPIHLVKSGPATQIFTAPQAYSGNTSITAGTLRIDAPSLADASTVTIASGARLHLNFPGTDTIAALTLGTGSMPPGSYSASSHPSFFSGTGILSVPLTFSNWMNNSPFSSPADRAPTADPDNDGIPNLIEYALGTSAHSPQALPVTASTSPGFALAFYRIPARSDITLTVESSSDLRSWSPVARSTRGTPFTSLSPGISSLETPLDADRIQVTITLSPSVSTTRFLRLTASP